MVQQLMATSPVGPLPAAFLTGLRNLMLVSALGQPWGTQRLQLGEGPVVCVRQDRSNPW